MDDHHVCTGKSQRSLFCGACGRLLEPGSLRTIKFKGFTGTASLNSNVEEFWSTGDPAVFERPAA